MIKSLFPIALLLMSISWLQAQTPRNITVNGTPGPASGLKMMCNEAGTISFGAFIGQSNDVDPDTIFLCLGDSLRILHNGDFDLSGDPNPNTLPGIAYAFYDCPPSDAFSGPDLATIQNDPCMNTTSPIVIGGVNVDQDNGIWLSPGEADGDSWFFNNGQLQSAFNNGVPGPPIQFFFAPITVDDLAMLAYEEAGGMPPAGPCVDVNTEEAFSVVYLNAIAAANLNTMVGPNGCSGSFTLRGGLPEFTPSATYDIRIELDSDPNVTGTLTFNSTPNHNESTEFFVPQPGVYNIIVEDGKSCGLTFQMDMSGCSAITFSLPLLNATPGNNICLPVTVEDFAGVTGAQFSISWDPFILNYTGTQNYNTNLPGLTQTGFNVSEINQGRLGFLWFDINNNEFTLTDGSVLFEVCFDVIGNLGESTPVVFGDAPVEAEVGNSNADPYGLIFNNGQVNVSTAQLFVSVDQTPATCFGDTDGSFTVTVAGGMAPYSVTWNTVPPAGPDNGPEIIGADGGSFTVADLPAGVYLITVADSDAPANTFTEQIEVQQPPEIQVNIAVESAPLCNAQSMGDSLGSLRADVFLGGVAVTDPSAFDFIWSAGNTNGPILSGVTGGSYSVTVTDDQGCSATDSGNLPQPLAIQISLTEPVIDATCDGSNDGSIRIAAAGGVADNGNYTIDWGPTSVFASVSELNNLNPGQYCVTVTDANGCQEVECFSVNADKRLQINPDITDVGCNGESTGAIFAGGATIGAAPSTPYTFTWEGNVGTPVNTNTSSSVSNLTAGTYIVTMTDSDPVGCLIVDTFIVLEPALLEVSLLERINETCIVGMDGSATPEVTGGTYPYAYNWVNDTTGVQVSTDSVATGLSQGSYTLEVIDANNCVDSLTVIILAPTPPDITQLDDTNLDCAGDTDGVLTVSAQPTGAPIVSIQWSNGQTGPTASNLSPGVYYVAVTAQDACVAVDSAFVLAPPPLELDSIAYRLPECPGDNNGQITILAVGGTQPYTFEWSTNPGTPTAQNPLTGLTAGNYSVTVTDANNCPPLELELTLADPPTIDITFTIIDSTSCFGESICDGSATAQALYSDGTTGSFDFFWLGSGETELGVSSSTATSLCRGDQLLVVSDGVCGDTVSTNIPSPPPFQVNPMKSDVTCNGLDDGQITLVIGGATPPYNIQWPALGQAGTTVTGLMPGTYTAVITDANDCVFSQTAPPIEEPDPIVLTVVNTASTPSVTCAGDTDGQITVLASGGTPAYTYAWAGNVAPPSSDVAQNLSPGAYGVTVTDRNDCQDSISYTITAPPPIEGIVPDPPSPLCFGQSTLLSIDTITGGVVATYNDYSYTVDGNGPFPPDLQAPIFAGPHTVIFFDTLDCASEPVEFLVTEPDPITVTFQPPVVEVELGDTTTQLEPIIFSTNPIASFAWSPAAFLSSDTVQRPFVIPGNDQNYTLTVTDANGCTGVGSVLVELDRNRNIYIPNVFSPNGDGINESFNVFACLGVVEIADVTIFDRWGDLVFQENNLTPVCAGGTPLWNGEWKGSDAAAGVYVYVIKIRFLDNVELTYRGDVTLLR